jgi:hypothetical protein
MHAVLNTLIEDVQRYQALAQRTDEVQPRHAAFSQDEGTGNVPARGRTGGSIISSNQRHSPSNSTSSHRDRWLNACLQRFGGR